jgi:hypothetical protein
MFFDIQKIIKKKEYKLESAGSPKIERKITLQEKMQELLAKKDYENVRNNPKMAGC